MDDKQKERIKEGIAKYFKSNIENQPIQVLENGTLEYLEDPAIKEIAKQLKIANKLKLLELHWNYTISDIVGSEFEDTYIKIEKELYDCD